MVVARLKQPKESIWDRGRLPSLVKEAKVVLVAVRRRLIDLANAQLQTDRLGQVVPRAQIGGGAAGFRPLCLLEGVANCKLGSERKLSRVQPGVLLHPSRATLAGRDSRCQWYQDGRMHAVPLDIEFVCGNTVMRHHTKLPNGVSERGIVRLTRHLAQAIGDPTSAAPPACATGAGPRDPPVRPPFRLTSDTDTKP